MTFSRCLIHCVCFRDALFRYPSPTTIQQRYCYPDVGRAEYKSRTGGALWTLCDDRGKDDTEYRLLHVYLSAKRAANQGVELSQSEKDLARQQRLSASSPMAKKSRHNRKSAGIHNLERGPGQQRVQPLHHQSSTNAMVSTSTSMATPMHYGAAMKVSSPSSLSPLSFDRPQAAAMASPSTPVHRGRYGPAGRPYHHQYQYPQYPPDADQVFDDPFRRALSSDGAPPFVTPLHGHRYGSYHQRASLSDDDDSPYHHRHKYASSNNEHHSHGGQLGNADEWHRHDARQHQPRNLEHPHLGQREQYLDDPRAHPAGDDPRAANHPWAHDGANIFPSHASFPSEADDGCHWQQQLWREKEVQRQESNILPGNGSLDSSVAHGVLERSVSRHPSLRQHRRSASDASSCSDATSALIGVTLDPAAWDAAADDDRDLLLSSSSPSPSRVLSRRLTRVQRSLRDAVLARHHPPEVRGRLVTMVTSWAAKLMLDPLAEVKEDAVDVDGHESPMLMTGGFDEHVAHQDVAGGPDSV
jgi:hypothetical protein